MYKTIKVQCVIDQDCFVIIDDNQGSIHGFLYGLSDIQTNRRTEMQTERKKDKKTQTDNGNSQWPWKEQRK